MYRRNFLRKTEEIGRLVGTDHQYKEDYEDLYPEIHKGAYKENQRFPQDVS